MGHDHEKLVRNKVRDAEQNPISWNKTGVWDKINEGAIPRKKKSMFYFAAASLLIGAACIIYLLQLNDQNEHNAVPGKPSIVQQSQQDQPIVKEHENTEPVHPLLDEASESIKVDEQTVTKLQNGAMKTSVTEIEINELRTEDEFSVDLPYADPRLTMDIHDSTKREKTSPRQRIEPIIGVIPKQPPVSVAKEKKLRVRILRQPVEGAPDWQTKENIFTARIN